MKIFNAQFRINSLAITKEKFLAFQSDEFLTLSIFLFVFNIYSSVGDIIG